MFGNDAAQGDLPVTGHNNRILVLYGKNGGSVKIFSAHVFNLIVLFYFRGCALS